MVGVAQSGAWSIVVDEVAQTCIGGRNGRLVVVGGLGGEIGDIGELIVVHVERCEAVSVGSERRWRGVGGGGIVVGIGRVTPVGGGGGSHLRGVVVFGKAGCSAM